LHGGTKKEKSEFTKEELRNRWLGTKQKKPVRRG